MNTILLLASLHFSTIGNYDTDNVRTFTPGIGVEQTIPTGKVAGMVYSNSYGDTSVAAFYGWKPDEEEDFFLIIGAANGYEKMHRKGDCENGTNQSTGLPCSPSDEPKGNDVVPMIGASYTFQPIGKIRPMITFTMPGVLSFGAQF